MTCIPVFVKCKYLHSMLCTTFPCYWSHVSLFLWCCFQVLEVDQERGRFLLSLRPSHLRLVHRVADEEGEVREKLAMRLQGYLEERDAVLQAMTVATGQMHTYIIVVGRQNTAVTRELVQHKPPSPWLHAIHCWYTPSDLFPYISYLSL